MRRLPRDPKTGRPILPGKDTPSEDKRPGNGGRRPRTDELLPPGYPQLTRGYTAPPVERTPPDLLGHAGLTPGATQRPPTYPDPHPGVTEPIPPVDDSPAAGFPTGGFHAEGSLDVGYPTNGLRGTGRPNSGSPGDGRPMPPTDPMSRASRRTGAPQLVLAELRKLSGTLPDRILLIVGPLVLIAVNLLLINRSAQVAGNITAADQIGRALLGLGAGPTVVLAALIRLVAGDWEHRSAHSTLLVQPSRVRYLLAQTLVAAIVWLVLAVLQTVCVLITAPISAHHAGTVSLLGERVGWVVGLCLLGTFAATAVALVCAMLLPNSVAAIALYVVSVPVVSGLGVVAPQVFRWIDPLTPVFGLAGYRPLYPAVTSVLLWTGLAAAACWQVLRRDA